MKRKEFITRLLGLGVVAMVPLGNGGTDETPRHGRCFECKHYMPEQTSYSYATCDILSPDMGGGIPRGRSNRFRTLEHFGCIHFVATRK